MKVNCIRKGNRTPISSVKSWRTDRLFDPNLKAAYKATFRPHDVECLTAYRL